MKHIASAALLVTALFSAPVSAAVLVDGFPPAGTTPFETNWTNQALGQNFLVRFTLADASSITGMSILSGPGFASVGDAARLKIRADVAGAPAATNLFSFTAPVASVTGYEFGVDKVTATFTAIDLAAGSYWIGLSGDSTTFVWASYNSGGSSQPLDQVQLSQDNVVSNPGIYSLAYQIESGTGVVPEPATWAMMIIGFGLVGFAARKRRAVVAA